MNRASFRSARRALFKHLSARRSWLAAGVLLAAAASASIHPVAAQASPCTECIVNGDFSGDLDSWEPLVSTEPGPGNSISIVDDGGNKVLQMSVVSAGLDWHVQTSQVDQFLDSLSSSTTYTLGFRAKASDERPMRIDLYLWNPLVNPPDYRYLGLRVVPTIGTSWQTYAINFRTEANMPNAHVYLTLAVGRVTGTFWVDDISLQPTPTKILPGADPRVFSFDPAETWLTKSIQNSPNPPDVRRSDTTHVREGSALKLAAGASGRDYAERQAPLDFSADNWEMTFWAYVDNPANLADLSIDLRSDGADDQIWKWWSQTGLVAGWNQIVLPKTQFYGVFFRTPLTWSGVWDVGLKLETNENGPASVWIDDLRVEPAAPDRRPPVISWVNLDSLSATAVTVAWTTDESATSRLDCGTSASYGLTQSDGTLSGSHSLTLGGLAPNTLYHCQVSSDDAGARTGGSGDFVFRTDPATPWVPPDPAGVFQVGLFGVPGWDDTGTFNLDSLHDPLLTRFTRFYGSSMTWETDPQLKQYLDTIGASGRGAFIGIDGTKITGTPTTPPDLDSIAQRVSFHKGNSAVAGWYLYDEPEYYGVDPVKLENAYTRIKTEDPSHLVTFAAPGFGPNYQYLSSMDYGILDPYPIPFAAPDSILTNLSQANDAGKPFDMTVQAYQNDLNHHWPGDEPGPGRFPTRDEMRSLAYLALNHGAGNMLFYGYWEAHVVPGVTWAWTRTNEVANELIRLGPIYSSSDPLEITFQSSDRPDDLDVGVKQYQGKAYATVVNRSGSTVAGTLTFASSSHVIQSAKEVVTQRSVASTWTTLADTWPGSGVNIYEIALAAIPPAPSGLSATAISPTQVNLSWTDNSSNEDGFKVRRATSADGPFSSLSPSPGPNATTFSDTTVSEGTQYWYQVTAYRTITPESGAATADPVAAPLRAPTALAGTTLAGRVNRLTWTDTSSSEAAFEVQRALKNGSACGTYATIGTAAAAAGSGSTVTYNDAGSGSNPPLAAKTYCYRVRSTSAVSQSTWAGPVLVKTVH